MDDKTLFMIDNNTFVSIKNNYVCVYIDNDLEYHKSIEEILMVSLGHLVFHKLLGKYQNFKILRNIVYYGKLRNKDDAEEMEKYSRKKKLIYQLIKEGEKNGYDIKNIHAN